MEIIAIIIALTCIIAGFIGIIAPYLPDAPLVFLGIFLYAVLTGFNEVGIWFVVAQLIATIIISLADYAAGAYGVKRLGGSTAAQICSMIGGLIGLISANITGLIIGTLLGAMIGELFQGSDINKSIKIGVASVMGFLGGALFKIIAMIVMSGVFVAAIIF